jgi:hypothetical protein
MMGFLLGPSFSISPVVTRKEYLNVVDRAFDSLSHQRRGAAYEDALENLAGGRPVRAASAFSSLVERRPDDPTLHRMLGISYSHMGNARLAARHLETALMLLGRAATPGISLLRSLRIEFEACVVRLALMAVYKRVGHRAGVARCLLAQNRPVAWGALSRRHI